MTEPKPPQWPLYAGGVLAIIGVTTFLQNSGREEGQERTAQVEQGRRMEDKLTNVGERLELVHKEIERVNQLSVERSHERREEMLQRHNQQQREIEEIKAEVRDLAERKSR